MGGRISRLNNSFSFFFRPFLLSLLPLTKMEVLWTLLEHHFNVTFSPVNCFSFDKIIFLFAVNAGKMSSNTLTIIFSFAPGFLLRWKMINRIFSLHQGRFWVRKNNTSFQGNTYYYLYFTNIFWPRAFKQNNPEKSTLLWNSKFCGLFVYYPLSCSFYH